MIGSILVPLDGSSFGEHALPWAVAIARRTKAPIRLLHVYVPVPAFYPVAVAPYPEPVIPVDALEWPRAYLDAVAADLRERVGTRVTAELVSGHAVAAVREAAGRGETALVVMTSHGRSGLSRAWLGSVADGVVRTVGTPVLVVRPEDAPVEWDVPELRRILVPLDGSALSEQVLPVVRDLARNATPATITLLHMEPYRLTTGYPPVPLGGMLEPATVEADALEYLHEIAQRLDETHTDTVVRTISPTRFADTILTEAKQRRANLIAMATHGRGGLRRALLGSVADKVLRGSTLPLLLVRPRRSARREWESAGLRAQGLEVGIT